jgi:hypothetical protein
MPAGLPELKSRRFRRLQKELRSGHRRWSGLSPEPPGRFFPTICREAHDGSWLTGDVELLHPAAKSVGVQAQYFGSPPFAVDHSFGLLEHRGDVFAFNLI